MAENILTIKSASEKYDLSQVYIRRAIRNGDIETEMKPISEGSKIKAHTFTVEAFEDWRASRGGGSRRADGRNKFVLYANKETEIQAIREAIEGLELEGFNVDELLGLANPPKSS